MLLSPCLIIDTFTDISSDTNGTTEDSDVSLHTIEGGYLFAEAGVQEMKNEPEVCTGNAVGFAHAITSPTQYFVQAVQWLGPSGIILVLVVFHALRKLCGRGRGRE